MNLLDSCLEYINKEFQKYIEENIEEILSKQLDDVYNGDVNNFLKLSDETDGFGAYIDFKNDKLFDIFSNYCRNNNVDNEETLYEEVLSSMKENSKYYASELYKEMKIFAKEYASNPELNKYMTGEQLSKLDDKIGDEIFSLKSRDWHSRDNCFIDIDGTVLIGDGTHAELINEYLESINKSTFSDEMSRPENIEMEDIAKKFSFGEIESNVWFVEDSDYYGNIPVEETINDIKKSGYKPEKIYIINDKENLTRAAKIYCK